MKLYATTTSERASKGQGGNDFLSIKIQAGRDRKTISTIEVRSSKSSNGVEIFTAYADNLKIGELLEMPEKGFKLERTARKVRSEQIKGEKKKGECVECHTMAYLSGIEKCPKCTEKWVKQR